MNIMHDNIRKIVELIAEHELDYFIAYGKGNVRYFTGYEPFLGDTMLFLSKDGDIKIVNRFEWDISSIPNEFKNNIISSSDFASEIIRFAGVHNCKIGVTGLEYMPFKIYSAIVAISNKLLLMDDQIADIRMVKSEKEIELIKRAVTITEESIARAANQLKNGITEAEIGALFEFEAKKRNAPELAFGSSVAFGKNASNIAWIPTEKQLKVNEAIFFDVGARYKGYCADIGRTYFYGKPSKKYLELYSKMLMIQHEIIDFIKPGMQVNEPYEKVVALFEKNGLGIPRHRLGHGVGIETSMEGPDLKYGNAILKPNMTFAIEISHPGTEEGGIKIEDNVVLRDYGCEILSNSTKELVVIDAISSIKS